MSKQLQIKLLPDGHIEAVTHGIKGKKCTDYIKILEQLLDARTIDSEYTDEYYIQEENIINENQQTGGNVECQE